MLLGVVPGFSASLATGNPWFGLAMAMLAAVEPGARRRHDRSFQADQVVSGLSLTFLGTGLALVLGNGLPGRTPADPNFDIAGFVSIPSLGQSFLRITACWSIWLSLAVGFYRRCYRARPTCGWREAGRREHNGRQRLRAALLTSLPAAVWPGWPGDDQPAGVAGAGTVRSTTSDKAGSPSGW